MIVLSKLPSRTAHAGRRFAACFSLIFALVAGGVSVLCLPAALAQQGESVAAVIELPEREGDLLTVIRRQGELRVGVSTFTPWAMRAKNGELIGFEIDVARQLADDLGVALKLVPTSWGNIISDLLDGHYDVVASGLSITPQRALLVDFSDPYNFSTVEMVANRQRAGERRTPADFNTDDTLIGARAGTTASTVAERTLPRATLKTFDDDEALYQALMAGELHAAVASSPRPTFAARHSPDELFLPRVDAGAGAASQLASRVEAFAVRKGNQGLLNYLDAWVGFHAIDGFLDERQRFWFGTLDWREQL